MEPSTGEQENHENSENSITFQQFWESQRSGYADRKRLPEPEKIFLVEPREFTCEHCTDVSVLLDACEKIIDFIYDTDKRDSYQRTIPKEYREDIHSSTAAALLKQLAKPNRPHIRPPRHARFFGKHVAVAQSEGTMYLLREGITLPIPPDLATAEIIKLSFVEVYDSYIWVLAKVKTLPFNISMMASPVYRPTSDEDED